MPPMTDIGLSINHTRVSPGDDSPLPQPLIYLTTAVIFDTLNIHNLWTKATAKLLLLAA